MAGIHRHHTPITGSLHRHTLTHRASQRGHTLAESLPALAKSHPHPQASTTSPPFLSSPPFGRLEKAATLSQQMARGRSWRVFGEDSSELFTRLLCTQSKWRVYSGLSRLGQCVRGARWLRRAERREEKAKGCRSGVGEMGRLGTPGPGRPRASLSSRPGGLLQA